MSKLRCSVFIAASLDGFIARSDGSLDWLDAVEAPGEDYGYAEFFASVDALIIGRKTYDTATRFDAWPYSGKRCVVVTHRPQESLHGEEFHAGELRGLLSRLSAEGIARAYVDGGTLISQFLAEGLIDDLTVSIVPVLLGSGARLFHRQGTEAWFKLISARSFPSGLVQVRYERAPSPA